MNTNPPEPHLTAGDGAGLNLITAYGHLQRLLMDGPDVAKFLQQLALLSAALLPGTSCGLTMRRDGRAATVAHSDDFALELDEIQHHRGQGPCLQALHTGQRVDVADLSTEQRWTDYAVAALTAGAASSASIPLIVDGNTIGALNLYSRTPNGFGPADISVLEAYAQQAATTLTLLLRHAHQQELQDQITEGLATRAVIDQALGILMGTQKITSDTAFAMLREQSQRSNRKVSYIANDLIHITTGHPAQPPRPFTDRS